MGYNNVAFNLNAQGRYGEAQPLQERVLAIYRKTLGEEHPSTAKGYRNVAYALFAQARYGEAQPLFERGLAISRKTLGEEHPDTAMMANSVAGNLSAQGRYAEAQPIYERALAIWRKALGEDHPDTARGYDNLAFAFFGQGRYAEAQPLYEHALRIRRTALGENHPDTARSYSNLASNLEAQGRYDDAEKNWTLSATAFEKLRGRIALTGMDRAVGAARVSPFPPLACLLARRGALTEAWNRYEQDLARGLLDDLSTRQFRRISDEDRHREQRLSAQLKRLDILAEKLAGRLPANPQEAAKRETMVQERLEAQAEWTRVSAASSERLRRGRGKGV